MTKDQLLAELRLTRAAISTDVASIRRELDFKAKLASAVQKKPWAWFGGAAALGWWLAGPKRKTRVVTKFLTPKGEKGKQAQKTVGRAGWLGLFIGVARIAFPYLRPVLSSYASEWLAKAATRGIGGFRNSP